MYRQHSNGQGRRSSAPKRLSGAVSEADDRNRNVSDGKKSAIPRPTAVSSRSSSVERDGVRNSELRKGSNRFPRNASAENVGSEDHPRPSHFRARSHESLVTPSHPVKTPSGSKTTSLRKTVKKDARPISERAFQIREVCKVQEYLAAQNITSECDLQNCMTLKLFVHIMNSLLQELFPMYTLTLSNYCELIPLIMRKLKYPGNITRSWLVTANSSHTWPTVLGLLSWLVDLHSFHSSSALKFIVDKEEDDIDYEIDYERVRRLYTYTRQKYIDWSENDLPFDSAEDKSFFDELVVDQKISLEECLTKVQKEIQDLQEVIQETESPEQHFAKEKLKAMETELEEKKVKIKGLKEKVCNLQNSVDRQNNEKHSLLIGNENLKERVSKNPSATAVSQNSLEDFGKIQSEVVSLRNVVKMQDTHVTDISNQCYSSDMALARLQGKLDKVRLQRDALLRGCTSENIDAAQLHIPLKYGHEDNSDIMTEYIAKVKDAKQRLENIVKELSERQNSGKMQMNDGEEKLKMFENQITVKLVGLEQYEKDLLKEKKALADLRSQLTVKNEEYSKKEEMQISLKHAIEMESTLCLDLQKELQILNDSFLEEESKFSGILKRMGKELVDYVKECKEIYLSSLKS